MSVQVSKAVQAIHVFFLYKYIYLVPVHRKKKLSTDEIERKIPLLIHFISIQFYLYNDKSQQMLSQGTSKIKPNSSQLESNSLQYRHYSIKFIELRIGPIYTEPIEEKNVAYLRKPRDCTETLL